TSDLEAGAARLVLVCGLLRPVQVGSRRVGGRGVRLRDRAVVAGAQYPNRGVGGRLFLLRCTCDPTCGLAACGELTCFLAREWACCGGRPEPHEEDEQDTQGQ